MVLSLDNLVGVGEDTVDAVEEETEDEEHSSDGGRLSVHAVQSLQLVLVLGQDLLDRLELLLHLFTEK